MGLFYWTCRNVPSLALAFWVFLCVEALTGGHLFDQILHPHAHIPDDSWRLFGANIWELLYVGYTVFAHVCACVIFPARLCWSVWALTGEVRRARAEGMELARPYAASETSSGAGSSAAGSHASAGSATLVDDKASSASLGVAGGRQTPEAPLSGLSTPKMGWNEGVDEVVHAIILPSYKEDMDTMRETLSVLASHLLAKSSYDVREPLSLFLRFAWPGAARQMKGDCVLIGGAGLPCHGAARPGRAEHRARPHPHVRTQLPPPLVHAAPGRHSRGSGGQEQQRGLGRAPAEPQLHGPGKPAGLRHHGHGLYVSLLGPSFSPPSRCIQWAPCQGTPY